MTDIVFIVAILALVGIGYWLLRETPATAAPIPDDSSQHTIERDVPRPSVLRSHNEIDSNAPYRDPNSGLVVSFPVVIA